MSSTAIPSTRLLTDDALRAQCREDRHRSGGPGGQKRNKTSTAVRLVHRPTRTIVTATESRSLKENQLYALRRMRLRLAITLREPVDARAFVPPDWFASVRHGNRIDASHRHPLFAAVAGLLLDLLLALNGNPAAVALNLGVSTSTVVRQLSADPAVWAAANAIRAGLKFQPLTRRDG